MTGQRIVEFEAIKDDGVERRETLRKDFGNPGDEEADGAVGGAVIGAVVGAVVAGPIGALIGGAIGAASGGTAGAIDEKSKADEVVVTHDERRL